LSRDLVQEQCGWSPLLALGVGTVRGQGHRDPTELKEAEGSICSAPAACHPHSLLAVGILMDKLPNKTSSRCSFVISFSSPTRTNAHSFGGFQFLLQLCLN